MSWYVISKLANSPPRGRVPKWYSFCKKKLDEMRHVNVANQMVTGWYASILADFSHKFSKKDTFIAHLSNNDNNNSKIQSIIFGESITKK